MTQKELLYIEDALGHHKQMQTSFTDFASQLSDPELKSFVQGLSQKQSDGFQKFFALIQG